MLIAGSVIILSPFNSLFADDIVKDIVYNGNISLLDNQINTNQILDLNQNELKILRNMIYAKYGYIFRSNDLTQYFMRFVWYKGIKNNVENDLTVLDYQNIELIKRFENEKDEIICFRDNSPMEFFERFPDADIMTISASYDSDRGSNNYKVFFGIRMNDFLYNYLGFKKEDIQKITIDKEHFIGEIKQNGIRADYDDGLIWSEAKGAWSSTKLEIGTKLYYYSFGYNALFNVTLKNNPQYKHSFVMVIAKSHNQCIPYYVNTSYGDLEDIK